MEIKSVAIGNNNASEIISDDVLIKTPQDALDIMATSTSDYIILHEYNFEKEFFDLSTGIAGEILQKFSNYQIKLAIIGDYSKFGSKSLHDYIYESNNHRKYLFVNTLEEVIKLWKS